MLPRRAQELQHRAGQILAPVDAVFQLVQQVGKVSQPDIDATLNMGVGMVAILPQDQVPAALAALQQREVHSWVLGEVVAEEGAGAARLV